MGSLVRKTDPQTGQRCVRGGVHHAGPIEAPPARNLAELPTGDLELTVYREVGGCHTPVIVRYGVGGLGGEQGNPPAPAPLRPRKL